MDQPRTATAKLRLKLPKQSDYRALYPRRFREEVMLWADDQPNVPSLDDFLAQRRQRRADPTCFERVILLDDEPIGTVTAFGINRITHDCELGIVIVDPELWGQGLGQEALTLFYAELKRIGIRRVHLETFADNLRARRAFARTGFRPMRTYRDTELDRDVLIMSLTL